MPEQRYFFCHIPKTAGTSVRQVLAGQFDPEAVYPLPDDAEDPLAYTEVDRLRSVFESKGDQIELITGHFPYCITEMLGVPLNTFTVLRDPVSRTLSQLRYQRRIDQRYAGMSMVEAYATPVNLFSNLLNHMVKTLAMTAEECTAGVWTFLPCTDEHLERAKAVLESMPVVGVQSDLSGFVADLAATFGWDLGEPPRVNTTEAEDVDPALLGLVVKDNQLDADLYAHALLLAAERTRQRAGRAL
jgi:hypothetical protein